MLGSEIVMEFTSIAMSFSVGALVGAIVFALGLGCLLCFIGDIAWLAKLRAERLDRKVKKKESAFKSASEAGADEVPDDAD